MPQRIQQKRAKGWRMPPGAVSVARGPGRTWGNPWRAEQRPDTGSYYAARCEPRPDRRRYLGPWCATRREATERAVAYFRRLVTLFRVDLSPLRGKDLACFCGPGDPCHADALVELANRPGPPARGRP